MEDDFLNIKPSPQKIGYYSVRKLLGDAMKKNYSLFSGKVLDIGCGVMPYKELILSNPNVKEYIGMDMDSYEYYTNKPDLVWDAKIIPLTNNSVDTILFTEVLEHCPDPNAILSEAYRVLRPNGILYLTVPFLWFLHEVPYDEYRYTPFSLQRHLEINNFKEIQISALGGWNASLAQIMGLWIVNSPIHKYFRKLMRYALFPVYITLLKTDKPPAKFNNTSMFTGLYCICKK